MQQPIAQDQIGQPQQQMAQQQQMMYCPLRLVYDAPMIMQTGDQIQQIQQPTQSIYVNQPPWARPQNQVIYVQQIGPNLVPVQQIDPNMYMQQNIQYQQVIPQMLPNGLIQGQVRPMMTNAPTNMMQNFIPQGIIEQPIANYGYIQTNEVNMANVGVVNSELDRQNVQANQNVGQNTQITSQEQMLYRQVIPQMNQQMIVRPQVPMNQMGMSNVQMISQQNVIAQNNLVNVNRPVDAASNTNIGQPVKRTVGTTMMQNVTNVAQGTSLLRPNLNPNVANVQVNNNVPQNLAPNVQPMRQIVPNSMHQYVTSNMISTPAGIVRNANSANNLNTVTYSAVRNGQPYTYRAIQPKTNIDVRLNITRTPNQYVRKPDQIPNQSVANVAMTNTTTSSPMSTETDYAGLNKKRKSESPDEVQKKISNFGSITVTSQVKDRIKAKYGNTSEMGTNTSPVHKPNIKIENTQPVLQINPMTTSENALRLLAPAATVMSSLIKNEMKEGENKESKDVSQQTDVKKLVRKTVFPQAKNRLLDDKVNTIPAVETAPNFVLASNEISTQTSNMEVVPEPKTLLMLLKSATVLDKNDNCDTNNASKAISNEIVNVLDKNVVSDVNEVKNVNMDIVNTIKNVGNEVLPQQNKVENVPLLPNKEIEPLTNQVMKAEPKAEKVKMEESVKVEQEAKSEVNLNKNKKDKSEDIKNETKKLKEDIAKLKQEKPESAVKQTTDFEEEIKDPKTEKKDYKNISINEMKGKEIHIVDGNIHKQERDYILTHVLDGFVIQESNVPFAIRKPLKERTNAVIDKKQDPGQKNFTKEEMKDKILELSQLHLEEGKDKTEKEAEEVKEELENKTGLEDNKDSVENATDDKENPFRCLKQSDVKSWTVDDLALTLSKHWPDTVSVLQEHEIDGESLFLVSRTQLVNIGVSEQHADFICEFVTGKA